jgi:hypothetical protein
MAWLKVRLNVSSCAVAFPTRKRAAIMAIFLILKKKLFIKLL